MKINKIISIILLIIITINIFNINVNAVNIPMEEAFIENLGECEMHLQYWKESAGIWSYIITTMTGYKSNGTLHYAYCMQQDKKGVGGEQESYYVNISEMLQNPLVWRAVINGFPYKSYIELGVENEQDAFVATKQAIYCVIYNWDVNSRYRGADERGWQIVNAINNIVNSARNGDEKPNQSNNVLKINKVGNIIKDKTGNFTQEYEVISSIELSKYQITNIENFPEGVYVTDLKDVAKNTYLVGEHFKVVIPQKSLKEDIKGIININGIIKSYPVFYGKSYNSENQDYALTYDAYENVRTSINFNFNIHTSKLKIIKKDGESNKTLSDVEFNLKYEDGTIIGNYKTNDKGEINVENLKPGKIIITETKTQEQYVLDETPSTIVIGYNDSQEIIIDNYYKKGNLKIKKVDKDDNDVVLSGVKFELLDSNGNIIENLETDKNGEGEFKNLKIGNYTLREVETKKDYKIALDRDITIEWGKTQNLIIENEKEKGQIKIVKLSEDDNPITGTTAGTPLKNIEFEIYDENRNIVDKVITNEKGEAISKKLEKGKYKIKEVKSGDWFLLNNKEYSAQITKDKEIFEVTITNKSENPKLDIEKNGTNIASPMQEIKYEFSIKNSGNTKLNEFVWYDYLPSEYTLPLKLETGTYNQNLIYSIYYKTNQNEYRILKDNLKSEINNCIDFSEIKLNDDEYITEFKVDFGKVDVGFSSKDNPQLYIYVKAEIEKNSKFINKTKLEGYNKTFYLSDEDEVETEILIKRLPKTGY